MNPYLQPQGFLGTGASLLADLTLLAYVFLIIPSMLVGFVFARRGMHRPHHKMTMTAITIVNWILIIFLMFTAYRYDVGANLATNPNNSRYLLPGIHALFGIPAQLLATYVIYRMWREDYLVAAAKRRGETTGLSKYWFKSAKPFMRVTLTLWLITASLGVLSYLTRYHIIPSYRLEVVAPAATQELGAPVATDELAAPVETEEPTELIVTEEPTEPLVTDEPTEPITTEESASVMETAEIIAPTETAEAPSATEEMASTRTPTRAPSATRRAPTPMPPSATEDISPITTPEVTPEF